MTRGMQRKHHFYTFPETDFPCKKAAHPAQDAHLVGWLTRAAPRPATPGGGPRRPSGVARRRDRGAFAG